MKEIKWILIGVIFTICTVYSVFKEREDKGYPEIKFNVEWKYEGIK